MRPTLPRLCGTDKAGDTRPAWADNDIELQMLAKLRILLMDMLSIDWDNTSSRFNAFCCRMLLSRREFDNTAPCRTCTSIRFACTTALWSWALFRQP